MPAPPADEEEDAAPRRPAPDLAVVVMSVGAPPQLERAVGSLLAQGMPLEIVVVNSGGGDPGKRLRRFADEIRIVDREGVLWPGATRNVGIAETSAPFVAFLESDCTAQAGWAAHRLRRHHEGAPAVATALINGNPGNPFATASHFALFGRRLPGVPEVFVHRYGASFARALFDAYGLFREDLRTGEDTEFAARLPDALKPIWAPEVRAAHANPIDPITMLADQYRRGRRTAVARAALRPRLWQGRQPYPIRRFVDCARISLLATHGRGRVLAVCVWPLLACCVAAYTLGLAQGAREA
jgi:glycosyltransferase involved in cell wall biosynthesis